MVVDGWVNGVGSARFALDRQIDGPLACAVVDGMGGHSGGAAAAWLTARTLSDGLIDVHDAAAGIALAEVAHDTTFRAGLGLGTPDMGAVFAALVVTPGGVTCLNVGDARAHRLSGGYLGQLSVDDTVRRSSAPGDVALVAAIGGGAAEPPSDAHHYCEAWTVGTHRFLLCSDGIDEVPPDEVAEIVSEEVSAVACVDELLRSVLRTPARDNTTVIVVDVEVRASIDG
ncbi:PP2C family protein-serine/threonine phosphatase [Microbacterium karelineae]|uniref:PP2C family protein-serine/threonine phosphatase n=1 Tax=Microbacterium karelineae TaxID=2654283 RepID=UPI0018D27C17|nr:protein phosphatase 2C domain-containing protein [Microbacterium karelineae]